MKISSKDVQVYILAGGQNSRMGNNKGLLMWKGKTFVAHILHTLHSLFQDVIIISNQSHIYEKLNCNVIEDKKKEIGPIGGIYTGLSCSEKDMNLFVTCDAPLLSSSFLNDFLMASLNDKINFCTTGDKIHPLPVLLSKSFLPNLENEIQSKIYKLWDFYKKNPYHTIEMNKYEKELMNINTPEDYNTLISQ